MRKILLLICMMFSLGCMAQVTIPMESVGNTNYISASIGGRSIKFVFDTGATSVLLPYYEFEALRNSGKIQITGTSKVQVADGTQHDAYSFMLSDIDLGGIHIQNVSAFSIIGQEGSALFGMSAIKKLGNYQLRDGCLTLQDYANLTFDENFKVSVLGCRFGIDTFNFCMTKLKQRFEEVYGDDEADNMGERIISISNVSIGDFEFSAYLSFYNDKLSSASLLSTGWQVENAPKEGKAERDEIFRFFKQKYKYTKEAIDTNGYKYYKLGFTPECDDIEISVAVEGRKVYTVIVDYYKQVDKQIQNKYEEKKQNNALDDI